MQWSMAVQYAAWAEIFALVPLGCFGLENMQWLKNLKLENTQEGKVKHQREICGT
jgi:hypothetical protein